jgi:TRAP-type C4-dicarboxylate transport system permease small subunit
MHMKRISTGIEGLSTFLGGASGVCLVIACGLIIAEIANRSFFHATFYIVDEYSGYLMAISSFLGLSFAEKHNGHIRMELIDYLQDRFPKTILLIRQLCYILAALFALYLTMVTWKLFFSSYMGNERSYQVSETLLAIPQAFLPLGSFVLFLQYVVNFLKTRPEGQVNG